MKQFVTAGSTLAYEITGEGPLFVQLHGLTSSAHRETKSGLDMSAHLSTHRVLRYDARGHGSSTGQKNPEDYVWPQLAHDLLSVLDAVAPGERVCAAGPSMGAATLLHAYQLDPDRFTRMSLLVPPTAWATRVEQATTYTRSASLVEQDGIGAFIRVGEKVLPPPALAHRPRERVPAASEELLPSIFRGVAITDLPSAEDIKKQHIPTQILAWVDDHAHPVSTAEQLHRLIEDSVLSIARTPEDLDSWPQQVASFIHTP